MTAKDYTESKNGSTQIGGDYFFVRERPGEITATAPDSTDDWLYIVYINYEQKVMGYYQCVSQGDSYVPFVSVAAVNYDKSSPEVAKAISDAKANLDLLAINDGSAVTTNCSTFVRNTAISTNKKTRMHCHYN
uniref:Uncharacterized protein n=1 Tax=Graphocephala atropunctata TaxID=36148 RepID=A0A1B6LUE2_9HEMI